MTRNEFYEKLKSYKANDLTHTGIKGQKWGTRRWQNYDGTFNEEGKIKYFGKKGINEHKVNRKETYYNNRAEEDKRARNWELLKAGIKSAITGVGYLAAEGGVIPALSVFGLGTLTIPVVGGILVAKNLVKAGYNHIDSKYCEKKANQYYDMLKENQQKNQNEQKEEKEEGS